MNAEIAAAPPAGIAREPFPTWRIALFALGSVGNTVIGSLTGLMTYFYVPPETSQAAFPQFVSTATFLGLTIVGLVGYVGGIVAIVLSPVVASWSDRSRSRFGRRRVFMLWSLLPISVFSLLLFLPPVDRVSPANAAWLLGVVVLLNVSRTFYGVANAIAPEFGTTNRIIMLFSTFGAVGWLVGFIIGSQAIFAIKEALMAAGMSPVGAFRAAVGGLIAVSTILGSLQVAVVDEKRYGSGKSSAISLLPALKRAVGNRGFFGYVLTQQVYMWGDQFFQGGLVYFVTLLFGLPESMMLVFGAAMIGISLLLYPLVNVAEARFGKKALFSLALAMMIGVMLLIAFSASLPLPKVALVWAIVAVAAIPSAITGVVPGAIFNEIIREDCVRTGIASEASFNAANSLITAIPAGFVGLVMPSLLLLGKSPGNPTGARMVAIVGAACNVLALVLLRILYDEKGIKASLRERGYK